MINFSSTGFFYISIFLFTIVSCKKNNPSATNEDLSKPHIYMSGFYGNNAVYWRDKTVTTLGPAYNTTGIYVSGKDIYVCGNMSFPWQGGTAEQAVYWKNGNLVKLSNPPSYAHSITLYNQDIYVAGVALVNEKYVAVYWKNGIIHPLSENTSSVAHEIAVSGNEIYVVGSDSQNACFWKNDQKNILDQTTGSMANSIYLHGSDIYIAGSIYNQWLHKQAVYWKNGIINTLKTSDSDPQVIDVYANSIVVTESNLFISGWINNYVETLWINGNMKFLNNPAQYVNYASNASNISVYNNQPYISHNTASYWKNDSTFLIGSGYATGIFVSDE